jgi:hypothetical protein
MVYWHALDIKDSFKNLESREQGLSESEAILRIKKYGTNELRRFRK